MSGYTKPCIFCKQEIRLSNDTGKWLPYNLDNSSHECRESVKGRDKPFQQPQTQTQQQPQNNNKLTLEQLEQRITKLEELFGQRLQKIENLLFAIE